MEMPYKNKRHILCVFLHTFSRFFLSNEPIWLWDAAWWWLDLVWLLWEHIETRWKVFITVVWHVYGNILVKGRSSTKLEIPAVVSSDIFFPSGFRCHAPHLNQRPNTYHAIIITFIVPCVFLYVTCPLL